ncbi:hypothetical protein CARUB_v10025349mg, partial [Capsella rubella]
MMNGYTCNRHLYRPAITMSQFYNEKNNLRKLISSTEWDESKRPKNCGVKKVKQYLLQESFSSNIFIALKLATPQVKLLMMVDAERNPVMGYIYAPMDRAKEDILLSFCNTRKYKKPSAIIDRRWECQLHHPLHAACCFFNPTMQYKYPADVSSDEEMNGLFECIYRLVHDAHVQAVILNEQDMFKNVVGVFGHKFVTDQREAKAPAEWWACFSSSAPHLKEFAIKLLSLI